MRSWGRGGSASMDGLNVKSTWTPMNTTPCASLASTRCVPAGSLNTPVIVTLSIDVIHAVMTKTRQQTKSARTRTSALRFRLPFTPHPSRNDCDGRWNWKRRETDLVRVRILSPPRGDALGGTLARGCVDDVAVLVELLPAVGAQ